MPIWARAIMFGIELVGFLILCIFAIIEFYKKDLKVYKKSYVVKNMKFNLLYFSINLAIILALFCFTFPSYVFLSYNKLILVTVWILLSVTIILCALTVNKKWINLFCKILAVLAVIAAFEVSLFMLIGRLNIENKVVIYEEEIKTVLKPTMFSENQIGYTADSEGNIKTYIFYYQGNNEVWKYKELDASEVKVEKIKDADTYIEKTVISTSYCKQEKKSAKEDYIYLEEVEKYTIYVNINQRIEITD